MTVHIDAELTPAQVRELEALPAQSWFTSFTFRNAASPVHPNRKLAENNELKKSLVGDWIERTVKGKQVLDLFCANGAFSFLAAQSGAQRVVGIDFSPERIDCANFVASVFPQDCEFEFRTGDVYRLDQAV